MTFTQTYFKYPEMYHGQSLGEAFVNQFFSHAPYLHDNQLKLKNTKNNRKALHIIWMCYNDLNKKFDGEIYEQTRSTPPSDSDGQG